MMNDDDGALDRMGPWVIWIGITILMVVATGVMLDKNVGIEDEPPEYAAVERSMKG